GCAAVPIRIAGLSLSGPMTVTYGGTRPETWSVEVGLSSAPQVPGTMMIMASPNAMGGTFTASLPVRPVLRFFRADGATRILDFGDLPGQPTIQFTTADGQWLKHAPPEFNLIASPAGMSVVNPPSGPLPASGGGFFPGLRADCCQPGCVGGAVKMA